MTKDGRAQERLERLRDLAMGLADPDPIDLIASLIEEVRRLETRIVELEERRLCVWCDEPAAADRPLLPVGGHRTDGHPAGIHADCDEKAKRDG